MSDDRRRRSRRNRRAALAVAAGLAFIANRIEAADEPPSIGLNAIAIGALSRTDLGLGMLEARALLSPHLLITAAPTVLAVEGGETEYQFRAAATLILQRRSFRLEDRNLWVFSDAGTTRYRNRLRLTVPVDVGARTLRLQLLDEVFYEEGGRGWFRNMLGAGVGIDAGRAFSADAYFMLQDDFHRPQASMVLLMLTAHLR